MGSWSTAPSGRCRSPTSKRLLTETCKKAEAESRRQKSWRRLRVDRQDFCLLPSAFCLLPYTPAMLADLDALMRARSIDTLLVPMHEVLHPAFRWISRGAKVTKGYAVKRAGAEPLLVTYPMERDEAAATGLATRLVHDFDHDRIFKSAPNPVAAYGEFFDRVLRDCGAGPSLAFAGNLPIHLYLGIADELQRRGWNVVRSTGDDIVQLARKRKERWEIDAIASVGVRTE